MSYASDVQALLQPKFPKHQLIVRATRGGTQLLAMVRRGKEKPSQAITPENVSIRLHSPERWATYLAEQLQAALLY